VTVLPAVLATLLVVVVAVTVVPVLLVGTGSGGVFLGEGAFGAVLRSDSVFDFLGTALSSGGSRLGGELTLSDVCGVGLVVSLLVVGLSLVISLGLVLFVLLLLGVPQVVPPLANVESTSDERWCSRRISGRGGGRRSDGAIGVCASGRCSRAGRLGVSSTSRLGVLVVVLLVVLAMFSVLAVVLPVLAVLPVFAVVLRLSFGRSGGRAGGSGQLSRRSAGRDWGVAAASTTAGAAASSRTTKSSKLSSYMRASRS
jgi:hypothetical protein